MANRRAWLAVGLAGALIFLGVVGFYLWRQLTPEESLPVPLEAGEMIRTKAETPVAYLKAGDFDLQESRGEWRRGEEGLVVHTATLAWLEVISTSLETTDTPEGLKNLLIIEAQAAGNPPIAVRVEILDQIRCFGLGCPGAGEGEALSVAELEMDPGQAVGFQWNYLQDQAVAPQEMQAWCAQIASANCRWAAESGFGGQLIDFSDYFAGLVDKNGQAVVIDRATAFPAGLLLRD